MLSVRGKEKIVMKKVGVITLLTYNSSKEFRLQPVWIERRKRKRIIEKRAIDNFLGEKLGRRTGLRMEAGSVLYYTVSLKGQPWNGRKRWRK